MQGYYLITDPDTPIEPCLRDTAIAIKAGTTVVQYRRKYGSTLTLYDEARQLRELCGSVPFIVNDRLDIALAVDADGIHVGQEDLPLAVVRQVLGPDKIIGVTVRTLEEALIAARDGASYLGVGPIFSTATKTDAGAPIGIEGLREIRAACNIPIAAIGGITLENAADVVAGGADMVCAIQAVLGAPDIAAAVRAFNNVTIRS